MFGAQYSNYPNMPNQAMSGGYLDPYSARLASLQQPQQMQQLPRYDIIQVNGKNGAEAFRMAPNSRCLLLDEKDPIVWLVTSDGAGYQTATPYTITPYQTAAPETDFNARLTKLEAIIYGKSDPANAQPTAQQPAGGSTAAE